jgi:hypothetical protein
MCQLCFERFEMDALSRDEDGIPQDICKVCATLEAAHKPLIQGKCDVGA